MKGVFISIEGIEGTGKSTQVQLLTDLLKNKGYRVIRTEEPGGTTISVKIRELLLSLESEGIQPVAELFLYNASRIQHVEEVIMPALERGSVVISDRFSDSTVAYQGYGRGIDLDIIASVDKIATGGLKPDITILIDLDVMTGLTRNRDINKTDRLEREHISFHERVRKGFLALAEKEQKRFVTVDGSTDIDTVHNRIAGIVTSYFTSREI
ncbi:MAG: dTMP kinase [Nitrospiraceae bacterium]|nr:MAG: dTMP kinase [Nitrospiraceae bacterium]